MIIDGIEYCVALFVDKEISETTEQFYIPSEKTEAVYFPDFYGFNQFVKENKDNPQYSSATLHYSLVEVIDGKPEDFSWLNKFLFEELSEDDIQELIKDFQEYLEEIEEHCKEVDEWSKQIHYKGGVDDYKEKHARLKDFVYVCPQCLRKIEDCRCKSYPYYLIQIDRIMAPIIQGLTEKGYKTTGCCAGHPELGEFLDIHISFDQDYDFDEPFPEGAKYSKGKHCVSFQSELEDYDSRVKFQRETIWKLLDWVEMLSENEAISLYDDRKDKDDLA